MPSTFPELSKAFDPALILPIRTADEQLREYRVEPASAELGLYCQSTMEVIAARRAGREPRLPSRVPEPPDGVTPDEWLLGDAYRQMVADGVPYPHIRHAAATAYTWIVTNDEDEARQYWETGWQTSQESDPEAPGPGNRAHRRSQKAGSSPTTSTGGESTTPNRGSGPGTSSRRGGRRRRR